MEVYALPLCATGAAPPTIFGVMGDIAELCGIFLENL